MNKVFNYIRVSSKEQNEARQIEAMEKFNKDNNITNAIIDSIITPTENTIIIDSFAKYNLRINELKRTCDDIIILGLGGVITEELANISIKSDEIRLSVSKVESDFKNDMSVQKIEIESQIKDVSNALDTFENTVNTVFKDGIVDEAEKILLQEKIDNIDKEKLDVDAKYNSVVNDENLSEDIKTELITKYEEYNDKHSELKSKIEYVISDSMINDTEKLEINTLFKEYANVLAYFSALMTKAVEDITFNTSKAELEQAKNDLKVEIDDVKDSIAGIGGIIDGTFENNILDEVERKDIKQSLDLLEKEKLDIDSQFNEFYNNPLLDGSLKGDFKNAYDDYILKYEGVVNVINSILSKEEYIDNTDRENLKNANDMLNLALSIFATISNKVIDYIYKKNSNNIKDELDNELNDIKDKIGDLESGIGDAFKDTIIDEVEVKIIQEHLRELDKEKLDIDAQFNELYNNIDLL